MTPGLHGPTLAGGGGDPDSAARGQRVGGAAPAASAARVLAEPEREESPVRWGTSAPREDAASRGAISRSGLTGPRPGSANTLTLRAPCATAGSARLQAPTSARRASHP